MWRHVILVLPLLLVGWLAGRAMEAHAAEPSEELVALAAEASVEPVHLEGAVNTTHLPPRTYLEMTGELSRPPVTAPVSGMWAALAHCEASGNWRANTGNSYYGGLQQNMTFWRRHGGLAFASRPDLASPAQQVVVAERGLAVQGWGAWPACSRRLGLRR